MILGIDISTYYEEQEAGARYFRAGKPVDILNEFKKNGISCVRIRLWVDPYSEKGEPYLAGTCDLANFLKLAKLVNSYEMSVMLDFHYSDFRCDPSKQSLPKAWENLSYEDLLTEVYTYTRSVLLKAKEEKIDISYIQIGNEITNGMLWPSARLAENADNSSEERSGYDKLIPLIKEGVKAAREVLPKAKLILHLERSFDQKIYDEFFGRMKGANVDFDIIGMSYYPYWHKGFTELFANVENVKKYGKDIMIVETGYAFTLESYAKSDAKLVIDDRFLKENGVNAPFPFTKDGQKQFVETLLKEAEEHDVKGVFYREPCWIPGKNICWASKAALRYLKVKAQSLTNEWANQCLFDYGGEMLPAFDAYRVNKGNS